MTESEGNVRVVGTAHVSAESVREVEEAIEADRPDVVAVELDEGRYRQLQGETPDDLDAGDLLEGNTVFQFLAYWMLSYVQAQMGDKFDIQPGAEMLAAIETAEKYGIDVALVDRDIQETIRRFWKRMTTVEKLQVVGSLVFGVTDPRIAGVTFGLLVGIFLGPLLGISGGMLGVTQSFLVSVTGAAAVTAVAGYALVRVASAVLDDEFVALGVGVGAGALLGVGLAAAGVTDPYVTQYLGDFAITAIGSMTLGIVTGVAVGLLAAAVMSVTGAGTHSDEEFEEFDVDELTDSDVVTVMMEEFREFSPGGAEALIDERDAFIAHHLVDLREQGKSVVAVVGAGHREGIERYLRYPHELPPMESLEGEEASSSIVPWGKVVAAAMMLGFFGFFVLLAMAGVRQQFLLELFAAWFLVNGVFAAGLAKLAGARWPSALVGGAVAWLTSINPLLAPGWFAGYVELRYTAVNVGDIATLNALLSDEDRPLTELIGAMFDVPLFRLIMVVAMTNVGSLIASFLFALYVLPAFFGGQVGGVEEVPQLLLKGAQNSADLIWRWLT